MTNIYVFDPVLFKVVYPQFKAVSDELLQFYFEKAESTILDNTETACVPLKERKILFYLLVAHYAELQNRIDKGGSSIVGRATSATEGSINVSFDFTSGSSPTAQWLNQTPYGAEYYMATAKYRTAIPIIVNQAMPVQRFKTPWGY